MRLKVPGSCAHLLAGNSHRPVRPKAFSSLAPTHTSAGSFCTSPPPSSSGGDRTPPFPHFPRCGFLHKHQVYQCGKGVISSPLHFVPVLLTHAGVARCQWLWQKMRIFPLRLFPAPDPANATRGSSTALAAGMPGALSSHPAGHSHKRAML